MHIQEEILNIKNQAIASLMDAKNLSEVMDIKLSIFGKTGQFTKLIQEIGNLPKEDRKNAGVIINEAKISIMEILEEKIKSVSKDSEEWFDATIPGTKQKLGSLHLVTQAIEEIADVFEKIGFVRQRYPEVEWDWYAFGALNFPAIHPARDDWETFFIDTKQSSKYGPMLLTPHTSSGQIREMERTTPPIRMINIAKCYRRQSDVSHVPMFHQFEGLVVDKNISISNLKGTLDYFALNFFGKNRKTRLRPYNFRFTEPSFEVDITCGICDGVGCKLCKQGWLELGGAGMVHPNVLKNGGIDPNIYSGFAFGWGVERTFMMKGGLSIPDIRLLYSSDVRFLNQF